MAKHIHLRGDPKEVLVPIHGNKVIDKGELVFVAIDGNCIVGAETDHYGYPADDLAAVTSTYTEQNFLGVAMKGSVSGTTEDIPVATAGIFRAQIKDGTSSTSQSVKVGHTVAAGTIEAGVSVSGTTVTVGTDGDHDTCRIGRCVRAESSAIDVDYMLMSRLAGSSIVAS